MYVCVCCVWCSWKSEERVGRLLDAVLVLGLNLGPLEE